MTDANLTVKATQSGFAESKAAVSDLRQEVAATNVEAGEGMAAAAAKGEAGLAALRAELDATKASAAAAAAEETAAAEATTAASAAASSAVPQMAALTAIFVAISAIVGPVVGGLKDMWQQVKDLALGLDDLTVRADKHGERIDKLSDEYQNASEAAAQQERAQYALSQGFVVSAESATKSAAALEIAKAALHGFGLETDPVLAALKEFGLKAPPTFAAVSQDAQTFEKAYQLALAEHGPAYAQAFLNANKSALQQVGDEFAQLGEQAPQAIVAIAKSVDVDLNASTTKTADAVKKLTDSLTGLETKQKDIQKAITDSAAAFQKETADIEANRQTQIDAIDQSTAKTIADLQAQVTATQQSFDRREITADQYNVAINTLYAEQAKARDSAYEQERKIDDDAVKAQQEKTTKYQEESTKQAAAQAKVAEAIADQTKELDALKVAQDSQFLALQGINPLLGTAADKTSSIATAQRDLNDALKESLSQLPTLTGQVGVLKTSLGAAADEAARLATNLDRVTGTGAGSGGGAGGGF